MDQFQEQSVQIDDESNKKFNKCIRNIITQDDSVRQVNPYINLQNIESDNEGNFLNFTNSKSENEKPFSEFIFVEKKFSQRGGNTPRLIVDLIVQHLKQFKQQYSPSMGLYIKRYFNKLKSWHLSERKNVYKLQHLIKFFEGFPQKSTQNERKTRKIFNLIFKNFSISSLKRPRSQIVNKSHYLRVLKVFRLRCRSAQLMRRNQSR